MPKVNLKISIVGAGNVGSVIASLLYERGIPIVTIIDSDINAAKKLAGIVKCVNYSTKVSDINKTTNLLFITTPDDEISKTSKKITIAYQLNFKNLTVLHTSGVHTSKILSPFKKRGARTLSFHPIQSFPKNKPLDKLKKSFNNIHIGIEGERSTRKLALMLATLLKCNPVFIDSRKKTLYHVACVFASNYISSILNAVSKISERLMLDKNWSDIFLPLLNTTIKNAAHSSPIDSLTGPIERGDINTIKMHIKALKIFLPELLQLYLHLAFETANLALQKGSINTLQYKQFEKLLDNKKPSQKRRRS